MKKVRNWIGVFGILLPPLSFICGLINNQKQFLESISATHYSGAYLLFEGLMVLTGVFLIFYEGYDIKDKIFCRIAAAGAILTAFFPTGFEGEINRNFLMIPMQVTNIIHIIVALIFFGMLIYIIMGQFTKSVVVPTANKLTRNKLYKTCGIIMIFSLLTGGALGMLVKVPYALFIGEWLALWAFGFAWLVKGEAIKYFNDKE